MNAKLLGENLRKAREALGLTQTQFGAAVGVKQPTVWGWENGSPPSATHLVAAAAVLGVTVDALTSEIAEGAVG